MNNTPVLIIEDELIIQENLARIIKEIGYPKIYQASSYNEAIEILSKNKINLLLIDVNLGKNKKSGLDIAQYLLNNNISVPFFFVTANSDLATLEKAKAFNPLGYIVKPFTKEMILANLKIHFNAKQTNLIEVKEKGKTIKIEVSKILFLKAYGAYVILHMLNKEKYLIRSSLKKLTEDKLTQDFVQVHKSYLVNKKFIKSYSHQSIKIDTYEIPIGRKYKEQL